MKRLTTQIDEVTMLKLTKRARRAGVSVQRAVEIIATQGVNYFLRRLVGATK